MSEISKMIEKVKHTAEKEDRDWMVVLDRYGCPMRWLYRENLPEGYRLIFATNIHNERKKTTFAIEMNRMIEKFNRVV